MLSFLQDFGIQHSAVAGRHTGRAVRAVQRSLGTAPPRVPRQLKLPGIDPATLPHERGVFNLVAFLGIALMTTILVIGIKESANLNSVIVMVKVCVRARSSSGWARLTLLKHTSTGVGQLASFIPPNVGEFGEYRLVGRCARRGVIFFAYIGFDAVSTAAQEAKNPQARHAHRHPRLAGHLHDPVHPGVGRCLPDW